MILLIDNYDSFTFNLYQMIASKTQVAVFRNDKVTVDTIKKLNPAGIIISPGPGSPKDAGVSKEVVITFAGSIPILGVCLGHQVIGECFGARITHAKTIYHGMRSRIDLLESGKKSRLFKGVPERFFAGRYHSLVVEKSSSLKQLDIAAVSEDDEVMSLVNDGLRVYGIQFHPESILTPDGETIIQNFLEICYDGVGKDAHRCA
ncbi:glutamine amidotransferase of anthranilate synthase [Caldicellulosiruptor obsidiansis OB47]|uniref:Glutamine amidotransferase of anthranilate synthase n=1 Tax=Caldicellulosiruptor obsidiansis (strain ATCC BAA-2073 / JCM 16842 / OB47) TaxID=608506 RepID=D9TJL7_CALOO|nr:aminodeoxychorismate/anthranilate synthase component II [Caldicellulosiruptor obsidiansis]ADL42199.1 glutamine amidotransferase of anthranilate synthase [Caldicellulosiruptor obsidiansis OB47]